MSTRGTKVKIIISDFLLAIAAFYAVYITFAFARLPNWLLDRFGEVSPEQAIFFLNNSTKGIDAEIKASLIRNLVKEPLFLAGILLLPAVLTLVILIILKMHRNSAEIANQIPEPSFAKTMAVTLLFIAIGAELAYPVVNKTIKPTFFYNPKPTKNVMSDPRFLIAHAGGAINGALYTNSAESLKAALQNNFKLIELDLGLTDNNEIAAVHDWNYFRGMIDKEKNGKSMSSEEFLAQKIYGKYTPLDGYAISEFFEANRDAILITDKLKDFKAITKNFKFSHRLIVEVFSYEDYEKALQAGLLFPALNLNSLDKVDMSQILKRNIRMATISDVLLEKHSAEITCLHKMGVTIMLYAPSKIINNPDYLKSVLGKKVSMVYVDYCSPKNPECKR